MVLIGDEAQLEAHFGLFGDSANLGARSCMICAKRTIGSETFCMHPMVVLADMG